jgi:hypothetical protein
MPRVKIGSGLLPTPTFSRKKQKTYVPQNRTSLFVDNGGYRVDLYLLSDYQQTANGNRSLGGLREHKTTVLLDNSCYRGPFDVLRRRTPLGLSSVTTKAEHDTAEGENTNCVK